MKKKKDIKLILFWVGLCVFVLAAGILEWIAPTFSKDALSDRLMRENILRVLCGGGVLMLLLHFKIRVFGKPNRCGLSLILPFALVAVCNFPFVDCLMENVSLVREDLIWQFGLYCLLIGIFEEFLFRGLLFSFFLERYYRNRKELLFAVLFSSSIFGLIHLFNLFGGIGIGPVLLQICYSFGIGAMLCMVLLCTENIWFCVLIHAGFDFAGLIFEMLGNGLVWSVPTIMITMCSSIFAVLWGVWLFFKRDYSEIALRFRPCL